eukprot:scaffold39771_cov56-Phaeocystis_antarctica.AAC.2
MHGSRCARVSAQVSHLSLLALGCLGGEGGIGAGAAAAAAGGVTDGSCVGWMAVRTCRFVTWGEGQLCSCGGVGNGQQAKAARVLLQYRYE